MSDAPEAVAVPEEAELPPVPKPVEKKPKGVELVSEDDDEPDGDPEGNGEYVDGADHG